MFFVRDGAGGAKIKSYLTNITWGSNHLWDIKFPDAPEPFNKWFPAIGVEENVYTLEEYTWSSYLTDFTIPKNSTHFTLSITALDDINNTLMNWITHWVNNEILNAVPANEDDYGKISPLSKSVKLVELVRLNQQQEPTYRANYWVFPYGEHNWVGENEAGVPNRSYTFNIAGTESAGPV